MLNAWLKVRAVGNGLSNHAAIGARIMITAGKKCYVREVQAGNSGNQNPLVAHFGLANYRDPVEVHVRFPSGKTIRQTVDVNQMVEILEPTNDLP